MRGVTFLATSVFSRRLLEGHTEEAPTASCASMAGLFEHGGSMVSVHGDTVLLSGVNTRAHARGTVTGSGGCSCAGTVEFPEIGAFHFKYDLQQCLIQWSKESDEKGIENVNRWTKDGDCVTRAMCAPVPLEAKAMTRDAGLAAAKEASEAAEAISAQIHLIVNAGQSIVDAASMDKLRGPSVHLAHENLDLARKAFASAQAAADAVRPYASVATADASAPAAAPASAPAAAPAADPAAAAAATPSSFLLGSPITPLASAPPASPAPVQPAAAAVQGHKAAGPDMNACKLMAGQFEMGTTVDVTLPHVTVVSEGTKMFGSVLQSDACTCKGKVAFPGAGDYTFSYNMQQCKVMWADEKGAALNSWSKDGDLCITRNQCTGP
mmetsp:Transcript_11193/g.24693  ORF Transcript_11193/g.24693 Transcript_11193/m.24693 type:complete len:381 (-) Transcript_11193:44-1186(-)|eukprot:CAMPEP_0204271600 /NCGR_PEP_ID=MMETSP0468-20130131/20439_1 /ASSEMBLY_ACC=CAM_ASM_000383 /TAXON_ID=2969 /ORGANISM="Oxyrrhis marina" /LENGTH=380 /DNA_ID=CAMNT_0051247313 /DNA_START=74 /DNA_END=1216 /DNA_ORIENTATION=-